MAVQLLRCKACGQTYYQGQKHTCPIQCVRCGQWFYTSVGHNCTNPPPPSAPPPSAQPASLDDISAQLERITDLLDPISIILRIWFWGGVILFVVGLIIFANTGRYLR